MADSLNFARCPVCRARFRGDEPPDEPCRRCGSDLTAIRLLYLQTRRLCDEARLALVRGDHHTALSRAWRAVAAIDEPATRTILAAALTAAGRPAAALAVLDGSRAGSHE